MIHSCVGSACWRVSILFVCAQPLLAEIHNGPSWIGEDVAGPSWITIKGNVFFVSGWNTAAGSELWKSDGTPEGTVLVKDINPGPAGSLPRFFCDMNGTLFFSAYDGNDSQRWDIWRSDGTPEGTVKVKSLPFCTPLKLYVVEGRIFFSGREPTTGNPCDEGALELWTSDGSPEGTQAIKTFEKDEAASGFISVQGMLYFSIWRRSSGLSELWRSDGTAEGTRLLKGDVTGTGSQYGSNGSPLSGALVFAAGTPDKGLELWRTDGTPEGTVLLKDIYTGENSSYPSNFLTIGTTVYFAAEDASHGWQLWKSNGTPGGTTAVKDFEPGFEGTPPVPLHELAGRLILYAAAAVWSTDGTAGGTSRLFPFCSQSVCSNFGSFKLVSSTAVIGEAVYAPAWSLDNGGAVLKTDGTPEGSALLTKGWFMRRGMPSPLKIMGTLQGNLIFSAWDMVHGKELWKSNGTEEGTVPITDMPQFGFKLDFERDSVAASCGTTIQSGHGSTVEIPVFGLLTTENNFAPAGAAGWRVRVAISGARIKSSSVNGLTVTTTYDDDSDPSTPPVDNRLDLATVGFAIGSGQVAGAQANGFRLKSNGTERILKVVLIGWMLVSLIATMTYDN